MKPNNPKIIISGGGTGGHIFPALAIADTIREHHPDAEILFVGANGKMEMEKVPARGYSIKGLDVVGFHRKQLWRNFSFPFKLWGSLRTAKRIVKEFNPDIAIGVGGYASGPLLRQAGKLGVPTLLQEQNSYAGITNKILAKKAKKICVAYDNMEQFFPKEKIVFTGNPVRKDIKDIEGKKEQALAHFKLDHSKKTILVLGGSLGARTINESIKQHLKIVDDSGYQVLWQTGKIYINEMQRVVKSNNTKDIYPMAFINHMDFAYAAADVIISRAGALSVSELCLVRKPCILVPSPNVAEDHQTKNAKSLVDKKAALLVKDVHARANLVESVLSLLQNEQMMQDLAVNISEIARPNATEDIYKQIMEIIK